MARTGNQQPESWPSMQEVYKSYIRNGYVMSDEGARKLSQKVQNAVAVRLASTDGWIEDAELAVEDKFKEIFWAQDLYPRDAVMKNRSERLGKAAEPVEEGIEEAVHANVQEASDAVSLQTLLDVCESHVNKAFRGAGVVTPDEHDFLAELAREAKRSHNPSLDVLLRDMYTDAVEEDDLTLQTWLDTELGRFYFERTESRMPKAYKSAVANTALKRCADNVAAMSEDYAFAGLVFVRLQESGAQTITPAGVREVECLLDEVRYDHGLDIDDVARIATKCMPMTHPCTDRAEASTQGVPSKERMTCRPDAAERDARAKAVDATLRTRPAKALTR